MANTTPSIYMNLPVPIPTVDRGPQYATDLNSCLTLIDSHTHSSGAGQQITPAGISINQDLPFFNNDATMLRSARFVTQVTPISAPTDLQCTYVSGVDLYYNDSNGNQVRLTQNGGVAGTAGSIGGLTSPANVSYVSGSQTFVFQSSTATPGNLDAASIIIRELVANGKGITLSAPAGLANNYSLTFFPILPASSTKFLTVDGSGNIGANYDVDNSTIQVSSNLIGVKPLGITRPFLGPVGLQTSTPIAAASPFNLPNVYTAIPNMSVQLTTTGRPVVLCLMGSSATGGIGGGAISATDNGANTTTQIRILRNDVIISNNNFAVDLTAAGTISVYFPSNLFFVDAPASSTYVYSLQGRSDAALSFIYNSVFKAYEL